MTETYGALRLERFAPTFRDAVDIVRLPLTLPGPGEIRVRNRHCGVNAIFDTQIARNAVDYVKVAPPSFTGVEAIGIVDAVGDGVSGFAVGDAAATVRFSGGYREANVGPEAQFIKAPAATREWLALASTGVSALLALDHVGQVQAGETVAVSAAAGGLGHFCVQLAVLRGARVIGVCGGAAKGDFVRSLGAERVVDYRTEDLGAVLAAEYPRGLDVAIDTVSGTIFDAFLANLAPHGRLVVGGAASDLEGRPEVVTAPRIAHAIYYKGASVRGFMNGLLTPLWPAARAEMFQLYAEGRLAVTFDEPRFTGLAGIYDASERLLSGQSMGKVVVDL
ncbi:zinc-binding dehydrogenase [Glacieibacterium frigidum]|uniref:Zinc-binding dehydrogenase n=1 Tax=Glacieibacterium frigidum TaxID=2593303 RepID=A0A552U893_9SPHN|nr:zinc-binding dehydrogenase [Glacieibacterium frigidum]TRW14444.1 zinc-binding dehydrogenase [Glacieibacterium frigidum]